MNSDPYYIVCLAFLQSLDDQDWPADGPAVQEGGDYARVVLGPFDFVRVCYDQIEARDEDSSIWFPFLRWDGEWWRVESVPNLPGFSDVEIRLASDGVEL